MKLEIGEKIEVECLELDYKADGVAKYGDYFVIVKDFIIGEKALVQVEKIKEKIVNASIVEFTKTSESRKYTFDLNCIPMINVDFNNQLRWQYHVTKRTLTKVLKKDLTVFECITDYNELHYRNKVVFHVLPNKHITVGLYNFNNDKLVRTDDFILANENVNKLLLALNESQIIVDYKLLRHVVFRNDLENNLLVTLVSERNQFLGLIELTDFFKKFDFIKGLTLNIKDNEYVIIGRKSKVLLGKNELKIGQLFIDDRSFLQVNYGVSKMVFDIIKENIFGSRIVDAYSGVGTIGYHILDNSKNITMIESSFQNTFFAKKIREVNNYNNVEIISEKTENEIDKIECDTLIVDPPRNGLNRFIIERLVNKPIPRLIYLSCDLQTLARDLKTLTDVYEIDKVYPIKMFPQTNSIETLIILSQK